MKNLINWTKMALWLNGRMIIHLLLLRFDDAEEAFYLLKIHLLYRGKMMKGKQSARQIIEINITRLIGLIFILSILFIISLIIKTIINL